MAWYTQGEGLGPMFQWLPSPSTDGFVAHAIPILSLIIAAMMLVYEGLSGRALYPRCLYLLTIALQPILASYSYAIYNLILFSVSHWIIAIALSGRILTTQWSASNTSNSTQVAKIDLFYTVVAGIFMLSVPMYFLFWSNEIIGTVSSQVNNLIFTSFSHNGLTFLHHSTISDLAGLIAGLYFGIVFIHFYYDKAVYSFQNKATGPLVARNLFTKLTE